MRLLLVEDDPILGDGLRVGLSQDGYAVDWVTDGDRAAQALSGEPFDAVILDLNLPGKPGLEVLKELRRRGDVTPVLVVTARDTVPERVQGLDTGADDYIVKPFDLNELGARVRALLRRSKGRASPSISYGSVCLDPASHEVTYEGSPVELTGAEFALLRMLLENPGRILTRERLEQALHGWGRSPESNIIEVHVHHLRKKLDPSLIRTVRGVGYVVEKPSR